MTDVDTNGTGILGEAVPRGEPDAGPGRRLNGSGRREVLRRFSATVDGAVQTISCPDALTGEDAENGCGFEPEDEFDAHGAALLIDSPLFCELEAEAITRPFLISDRGPDPEQSWFAPSRSEIERLLFEVEQERLERSLDRRGFIAECDRFTGERERLVEERRILLAERDLLNARLELLKAERDQLLSEREALIAEHARKIETLGTEGEALRARLVRVEQAEFELRALLSQVTTALQAERQRRTNPLAALGEMLGITGESQPAPRLQPAYGAAGFWAFTLGLGTLIIVVVACAFGMAH
jgi:hypothetical protein